MVQFHPTVFCVIYNYHASRVVLNSLSWLNSLHLKDFSLLLEREHIQFKTVWAKFFTFASFSFQLSYIIIGVCWIHLKWIGQCIHYMWKIVGLRLLKWWQVLWCDFYYHFKVNDLPKFILYKYSTYHGEIWIWRNKPKFKKRPKQV